MMSFVSTPATEMFEYRLVVPTVVKDSTIGSPIFYMDRGEWYHFKAKINDANMSSIGSSELYFQVQLAFVDESDRQSRDQLFSAWKARHPHCRLLEVATNEGDSTGRVMYEDTRPNMVRFTTGTSADVQFSLRINCLPSQFFTEEVKAGQCKVGFFLVVNIYKVDSETLLDSTLCQVRTFWKGRAAVHYEADRFLFDCNPKLACPDKFALLQTVLNVPPKDNNEEDDIEIIEMEQLPKSSTNINANVNVNVNVSNSLNLTDDERRIVCIFKAPRHLQSNAAYIDCGSFYELVLKPMSYDPAKFQGPLRTSIYLDFGDNVSPSVLNSALSNWSIINKEPFIFQLGHSNSELADCVYDVYQNHSRTLTLIWSPQNTEEIKLALKFNADSSQLTRFCNVQFLDLGLLVETFDANGVLVEKSECNVQIFGPSISSRSFEVDQTNSSLSATQTFEENTILVNTIPNEAVKSAKKSNFCSTTIKVDEPNDPPCPLITITDDKQSKSTKVVNIDIPTLNMDGIKMNTRELLTLDERTVSQLTKKILEIIGRFTQQPANAVEIMLQDMPVSNELLEIMFPPECSYDLTIFTTHPENGQYLAYLTQD